MTISTEQYLALSALVYTEYPSRSPNDANRPSIQQLIHDSNNNGIEIENYKNSNDNINPQFLALDSLASWQLISFQSSPNGFAAAAFQAPAGSNGEPGEIVFAFRGSEENLLDIDWWGTNAQIVSSLLIPAQFASAENFVFETMNEYGPVCYETKAAMYDALSESSDISFTGHSLGGGLAHYMTYKTANLSGDDGGVKSVTFNAVGIGQALDDPGLILNAEAYNAMDHVNSNDWVGNLPLSIGDTTRHIHNDELGFDEVDFDTVDKMLVIRLRELTGVVNAVTAAKELWEIQKQLGQEKSPDIYASTMQVYHGYAQPGGNDTVTFNQHHGLDTFFTEDPNSSGYVMTETVSSQQNTLRLQESFQLIAILQVIEVAKQEGNYSKAFSSSTPPANQHYTENGIVYIKPNDPFNLNPNDYTYSNDAIAYANYLVNNFLRSMQTSALAGASMEYQQAIASNVVRRDPLILDLDGDGIETTHIDASNAFFDLDVNGFAEKTGWVHGDDGLLALDRDQNGAINNGNELFGDRTLMNDGMTFARNGFEALAQHDSNQDGAIDASDSIYTLLRIWQDINGDGVSTVSELKSLIDLGIVSIALTYLDTGITDASDNIQVRAGEFTQSDGTTGVIGEYLFNRDTASSIDEPAGILSPEIAALPNIQGAGNVASLHKAMAEDSTGDLQDLVEAFMAETNPTVRTTIMEQILVKWAGSDAVDPMSRGGLFDAQKLSVMEKFFGVEFANNPVANAVPSLKASYRELLDTMYVALVSETHLKDLLSLVTVDNSGSLNIADAQVAISSLLTTNHASGESLLEEFARVLGYYEATSSLISFRNYFADQSEAYAKIIDFANTQEITGTSGNDSITANGERIAIDSGDGSDTIAADASRDTVLYAGAGNDTVNGHSGNDLLVGGLGNDALNGGAGNDRYIFSLGDGQDIITEVQGFDIVQFGTGITPAGVTSARVERQNGNITSYDLEITFTGTSDKLIIKGYFGHRTATSTPLVYDSRIEQFIFADGTIWNETTFAEMYYKFTGTEADDIATALGGVEAEYAGNGGNDTLTGDFGNDRLDGGADEDVLSGNAGNDYIDGGSGDDQLFGGAGHDTLKGNTGNDYLHGGDGNDTYLFALGDGQDIITDTQGTDTIQFAAGINVSDVAVARINRDEGGVTHQDLEISFANSEDKITVVGYFDKYVTGQTISVPNKIERIVFADGTIWTASNILGNALNIIGSSGADLLTGHKGNDTIDGKGGADALVGYEGNDTYVFKRGYGHSYIYLDMTLGNPVTDLDTIQLGEDIAPGDISLMRPALSTGGSKEALEIVVSGTQDKLILGDFFAPDRNELVSIQIQFANGTIWDEQYIINNTQSVSMTGTSGSDAMLGYSYEDDTIHGYDGNDTINGQGGYDTLYGDAGNDTLQGYGILDGGTGNDTLIGMMNNLHYEDPNTFLFGLGYGEDVITAGGQYGIVRFKEDIDPQDITVTRSSSAPDDILVTINGTSDTLIIKDVTGLPRLQFEFLQNNTTWDYANIANRIGKVLITGSSGDDHLYGVPYGTYLQGGDGNDGLLGDVGDDTIEGGNGNDYILGRLGDDVVDGGAGNDFLAGAEGSDTYIFGRGYGQDTISEYLFSPSDVNRVTFTADIEPADLLLERPSQTNDLTVTIIDTGEKLTITNYFVPSTSSPIQQFVFTDTTVWDRAYVDVILPPVSQAIHGDANDNTLMGSVGNDTIIGYAGNDTFMGMEGNDTLEGGEGNDVYMYIPSHGNDTIVDTDGSADMMMVGPTEIDMMFERVSDDLRVTFASTGEHITIQSWYDSTGNQIETLQAGLFYGGGSVLQNTQVDQLIQAMASYSSNNNGISWSQALQSNSQDVQTVLSQYWTAPTAQLLTIN